MHRSLDLGRSGWSLRGQGPSTRWSRRMKAAVCRAFGEPLVIEEVALDPPGVGEVAVDLAACAICHSDIIFADGGWGGQLPAVYGHEAAGVVRQIGPDVEN